MRRSGPVKRRPMSSERSYACGARRNDGDRIILNCGKSRHRQEFPLGRAGLRLVALDDQHQHASAALTGRTEQPAGADPVTTRAWFTAGFCTVQNPSGPPRSCHSYITDHDQVPGARLPAMAAGRPHLAPRGTPA